MSDIADISDGLLKMEDELKSFHEVLEVVDEARESAIGTIQASNSLNTTAQTLTENVRDLVSDIDKLDLDTKIELLNNFVTSLRGEINSVASEVSSMGENSQRGFDHLDSKLDEKIKIVQTEIHDGLVMHNGEIKGRIDAFEAVVERLKNEANSFHQKSQFENEKVNRLLLVLTILGSLAVLLLIVILILNIT